MKKLFIVVLIVLFPLSLSAKEVRVIYHSDETVSVIYPAPKSQRINEARGDWLNRVFNEATPVGAEYEDVDSSELPNRDTRDAWRGNKEIGVKVDVKKAADIDADRTKETLILEKIYQMQRDSAISELQEEGAIPK